MVTLRANLYYFLFILLAASGLGYFGIQTIASGAWLTHPILTILSIGYILLFLLVAFTLFDNLEVTITDTELIIKSIFRRRVLPIATIASYQIRVYDNYTSSSRLKIATRSGKTYSFNGLLFDVDEIRKQAAKGVPKVYDLFAAEDRLAFIGSIVFIIGCIISALG